MIFVGLPSDNPFKDLGAFTAIKTSWTDLETLLNDQKLLLGKLPPEATREGKDELVRIIVSCADWQNKLPENSFKILGRYIPDLKEQAICLPETAYPISKLKEVPNYSQTVSELNAFLDQRIPQIPDENQKIGTTQSGFRP